MKSVLTIEGMSCEHCANHVVKALLGIPGVKSAKVDLKSKRAVVESERAASESEYREAVEGAGYELAEIKE